MTSPLTIDERKALRRKAFWRVADFARYTGMSHWQAKSTLQRFNDELGGLLLRTSRGKNRLFGFYWAALAKHSPDAFIDDPLDTQRRVDDLEDQVADLHQSQRVIVSTVGGHTRDITRIQRRIASAS